MLSGVVGSYEGTDGVGNEVAFEVMVQRETEWEYVGPHYLHFLLRNLTRIISTKIEKQYL